MIYLIKNIKYSRLSLAEKEFIKCIDGLKSYSDSKI